MNNVFSNNPEQKDKQAYFTKMNEQYNSESSLQDEVTTTSLIVVFCFKFFEGTRRKIKRHRKIKRYNVIIIFYRGLF